MTFATAGPPVDRRHLRRVQRQIAALRCSGHTEDTEALQFVLRWAKKSRAPLKRVAGAPLLTTGEAGARLGVSDETVRTWARRGFLDAERRGSRFLIPVVDPPRGVCPPCGCHRAARRCSGASIS